MEKIFSVNLSDMNEPEEGMENVKRDFQIDIKAGG
jgi:hypothetical protein